MIERWLPEWTGVRGRPQHHPVHRHTVERHLLETVSQATAVGRDVARPDLLLLAALLHDIGKIAGARDHSLTGADLADRVLRRWGLPEDERATVVLLVREHLTLIETATRRDPADPATVDSVCRLVGDDPQTFELLRALTIADARGRAHRMDRLAGQPGRLADRAGARAPDRPCSAASAAAPFPERGPGGTRRPAGRSRARAGRPRAGRVDADRPLP
uniref:HD domain-containing protein n=1 Tax=Janibacter limosus TaxID=53458 RepID=A0AC61U6Q2_9MICO|nr:HD domain-containing protein [Janibacter limosus]